MKLRVRNILSFAVYFLYQLSRQRLLLIPSASLAIFTFTVDKST
jgi:hypothetical protein